MKPRVSVVVPVYNVEPFLRDCLDSVLRQTTADWDCVCVDDGSTDGSGAICDEYAASDPRFHVIHQRNRGLSAARNAALDWLDRNSPSEFVTFLDSDDWLAPNALEEMLRGASQGDGVAAFPFKKVEAGARPSGAVPEVGWRSLSIYDLWTSPGIIGGTACGKVFPRPFFSDIRFPVGKLHEDEWTTHRVLFRAERAALTETPLYFYRQHPSSIVNRPWTPKRLDALDAVKSQIVFFEKLGKTDLAERSRKKLVHLCTDSLRTASLEKRGSAARKCRRMLRWCVLGGEEEDLREDPLYWISSPGRARWAVRFAEIGRNWCRDILWQKAKRAFFRPWWKPASPDWNQTIPIQYAQLSGGHMELIGFVPDEIPEDGNARLRVFSESGFTNLSPGKTTRLRFCGKVRRGRPFRMLVDETFPDGTCFAEIRNPADPKGRIAGFSAGPRFPLSSRYRFQRLRAPDGRELRLMPDGRLRIDRPGALRRAARSFLFFAELFWKRTEQDWNAAFLRMEFAIWRRRHPERVWLFSDKLTNPIDNAYAVAAALVSGSEFKKEKISAWYLVDGKSPLRIRPAPGIRTVRFQSRLHKFLYLAAEANVTSEGGYNPFSPGDPYEDLLAWQIRVFTDHGVIHHDLSALYGRDFNGFNLVLSGAPRERADIAKGLWGYEDDEVSLTGLPRWDARESEPENKVYFGFTWRNNLVEGVDPNTWERFYGNRFLHSDYLAKMRGLFSDERLRRAAEETGCRLVFLPHPLLRNVLAEFRVPEWVETVPEDKPYEEIYRDASMLVTDYSSVAMDMAYLGKPVVYWQFDREEFYATQGYTPSFWSWEEDGFGPVTATLDETVEAIVSCIRSGFVREPEYERRAREFFVPRDKENGIRACRAVLKRLEKTKGGTE